MSSISEWSTSSLHDTRLSTGLEILGLESLSFDYDFVAFLARAQSLDIPFLPITWQAARMDVGAGGTSIINEALANIQTTLAFKRVDIKSKQERPDKQIFQILITEITVLGHPSIREHPNIVQLQGICWDIQADDDRPWPVLVFEKSQLGDLYHFASLPEARNMGFDDRLKLCVDIGRAINDMHCNNIIHGDIKPENVLIFKESGQYTAKVIDFGYSTRYMNDNHRLRLPISWPWNAPEHDRPAREWTPSQAVRTDIFSFGLLCFWLLFDSSLSSGTAIPNEHFKPAKDILAENKKQLPLYTEQLLEAEMVLSDNYRRAFKEFFDISLSENPQNREGAVHGLLSRIDPRFEMVNERLSAEYEKYSNAMDFKIENSIYAFYYSDYRLRSYIAKLLTQNYRHHVSLAFQMAFCYHIGFGLPSDKDKAIEILRDADIGIQTIKNAMVRCVETTHKFLATILKELWRAGHLRRPDQRDMYLDQAKLDQAEKRLVQEREDLIRTFGKEHGLVRVSTEMLARLYAVQGQWSKVEDLELGVVEENLRILGPENISTMSSMASLASTYINQSLWDDAEGLLVQLLETNIRTQGNGHQDTLTTMLNLASTYWGQGQYKKAEEQFSKVLNERTGQLGPEHPATLTTMNNIASTYANNGQWKEAADKFKQVLQTKKEVFGVKHLTTLKTMSNLATIYGYQGELNKAEDLQRQVMEARTEELGPEHPDTLIAMSNLASTYHSQSRWNDSEKILTQVKDIRKKTLGDENPDTIASFSDLASTYRAQGRWCKAQELGEEVVATSSRVLKVNHPNTLTYMANLAHTYWSDDQWSKAEKLFREIVEAEKNVLGPRHPNTLSSMASLASTYATQDLWNEAEELYVQVMEAQEASLGLEDPKTLNTKGNLAWVYLNQNRLEVSEKMLKEVIESKKEKPGPEDQSTLNLRSNLAAVYERQERLGDAVKLEVEVWDMKKRKLGDEHYDTLTSMAHLASMYGTQHRFDEAEKMFTWVIEVKKGKLGAEHPSTLRTIDGLAKMLDVRKETKHDTSCAAHPSDGRLRGGPWGC